MIWAKWKNETGVGTPEIIYEGKSFKDSNGITHPANIFDLWSAEELETMGWYEYVPCVVPDGKEAISYTYIQKDLQIVEKAITRPKMIPPKATNAEKIDLELLDNKTLLGIIRILAADKGISESNIIESIKLHVPDV